MRPLCRKTEPLMDSILPSLLTGKSLSAAASVRLFKILFSADLPASSAKSVLLLLAWKGETADELWGAVSAIKKLEKPIGPRIRGLIDTCGTGGDKSRSFNISTLAALVIAGAGCKVAKHGNRAISSSFGSSDLMESLGVKIDAPASRMFQAVHQAGIGYFHAPYYHPFFAKLHPLRRSLGRRTILNLLGPLVNPMQLDYQLVGVAEKRLLPLYAKVLARLGRRSALVCHSTDGMDEISTAQPTRVVWVKNGKTRPGVIKPTGLGLARATRADLRSAGPAKSRRIAQNILSGKEKGARRDAVILNAAYALWISGRSRSLEKAVHMAQESIDSWRAINALRKLCQLTNSSHIHRARKGGHC